jgi:hypothetical protein
MLIQLVIALIIVGVVLYLVTLIPLDPVIKKVIQVVVIAAIVIWLLQMLGGFSSLGWESSWPCKR